MALRQYNSAAAKITRHEWYAEGRKFTAEEMAEELGVTVSMVRAGLINLRDSDKLTHDGKGNFWHPVPHWINRTRLADTSFLPRRR